VPATGEISTVTGPVPASELGVVLPHEHVKAALWDRPAVAAVAYGGMFGEVLVTVEQRSAEVAAYRDAGGGTIVDVTPRGIGRSPEVLRDISAATGVRIVMGCGWYREPYYPPEDLIDRRSVGELADVLVAEIEGGADGTGVRPGIIGEIGVNNTWISAQEERVHRAAARAALVTGLAVTTHSSWSTVGLAQLDIFECEGLAADRVIIGHACSYPDLDFYLAVLERGAYLEFDNIGQWDIPGYQDRVTDLIAELLHRGHTGKILLSHDVWNSRQFKLAGGTGFTYLLESYLPELARRGVSKAEIDQMLIANPAAALAPRR
jgi:phosphotriesterase-related protein